MKKRKLKAAFTLEAAVVVPIAMVIIVSMLFVAFFIHDCVVMNTVSSYMIMENATRYSEQPEALSDEILQLLSRRMIIAKNISAEVTGEEDQLSVKGSSDFYMPIPMVQELTDISNATTSLRISNLNGRKTLLKYKVLCDGFRDVIGNAEESEIEET
ncbi:MAG: hypothetical protein MJ086_03850 [Lachnospiraceae bacterium]|nr:hypothetical protein [Lachnospiraceae bacterium]